MGHGREDGRGMMLSASSQKRALRLRADAFWSRSRSKTQRDYAPAIVSRWSSNTFNTMNSRELRAAVYLLSGGRNAPTTIPCLYPRQTSLWSASNRINNISVDLVTREDKDKGIVTFSRKC